MKRYPECTKLLSFISKSMIIENQEEHEGEEKRIRMDIEKHRLCEIFREDSLMNRKDMRKE